MDEEKQTDLLGQGVLVKQRAPVHPSWGGKDGHGPHQFVSLFLQAQSKREPPTAHCLSVSAMLCHCGVGYCATSLTNALKSQTVLFFL